MAKSKNPCKSKTDKPATPKTAKRITKKERLGKQGFEQGYKAIIKLPDGKKLIATSIGLADDTDDYQPVVFETKEQANISSNKIAKTYSKLKGVKACPSVGEAYAPKEEIIKSKPTATAPAKNKPTSPKKAKPTSPKTAANSSDKKSYTVKQGREVKTFSTKAEAKAYKAQCKNKNVTITEGTKKPTHRVVKFTARK